MKVEQATWNESAGWSQAEALTDAQLVLMFGSRTAIFQTSSFADDLASAWPAATRVGCSTAGQIRAPR
jgi:hypothetical protein